MPKEVSRAKEIAREAAAHYWVTDGMTEEQLAEYAVNLALDAAAKECDKRTRECVLGNKQCHNADAAAIRAMMEGKSDG